VILTSRVRRPPEEPLVTLEFAAIPGFLPGVLLSCIVGLALSGPVAQRLATDRWVAWLLVASIGTIVSATLTPSVDAIRYGTVGMGTCDLSRFGLASVRDLTRLTDSGLNVVLFIPLGFAVGWLGPSRGKSAALSLALLLPFLIETLQLMLPALDRACQSGDVIDNLSGLVVGLVVGTVVGRIASGEGDHRGG
jgi:hypothetical protein